MGRGRSTSLEAEVWGGVSRRGKVQPDVPVAFTPRPAWDRFAIHPTVGRASRDPSNGFPGAFAGLPPSRAAAGSGAEDTSTTALSDAANAGKPAYPPWPHSACPPEGLAGGCAPSDPQIRASAEGHVPPCLQLAPPDAVAPRCLPEAAPLAGVDHRSQPLGAHLLEPLFRHQSDRQRADFRSWPCGTRSHWSRAPLQLVPRMRRFRVQDLRRVVKVGAPPHFSRMSEPLSPLEQPWDRFASV